LEAEALRDLGHLRFGASCHQPGTIRLRGRAQRPIDDEAPWQFREAGGWERDPAADSLRRIVELVPAEPLPRACAGELVLPTVVDPENTRPFVGWKFSTYGPFQLQEARCAGGDSCPTGGVRITFSTPVKGAEVERRISLLPKVAFSVSDTSEQS